MRQLRIKVQETKGEWEGSQVVENLRVLIYSVRMKFYVLKWKEERIRAMASKLMRQVRSGRLWVQTDLVTSFFGSCVELSIAMHALSAVLHTFWNMSAARPKDTRGRNSLPH